MPLKVIGAGFPRTGTMSLKLALEELGLGPCHHMYEVIQHPEQALLWARAFAEEQVEWDEVLTGYQSATDAPSCWFYKQLAERYPDAKVILSLRDGDSWWRSAQATVMSPTNRERMINSPGAAPMMQMFDNMRTYLARHQDGAMVTENPDREGSIAAFERHNNEVQRVIPKDRLLVFEAKQGWEPLCSFLGVPVPKTPYPRVNTSEDFHATADAARAAAGKA